MKSKYNGNIKIELYGESHCDCVGIKVCGVKKGINVANGDIEKELSRRRPCGTGSTQRTELDKFTVKGIKNGKTTGQPIVIEIKNENVNRKDYNSLVNTPRPNHADFTARMKYGNVCDLSGGGHFSGRITAPLTAVGAVIKNALADAGITVVSHIYNLGGVFDEPFCKTEISDDVLKKIQGEPFPVINGEAKEKMQEIIKNAEAEGDSVGCTVELAVSGMPAGVGAPHFYGVENVISQFLFSVPAVKSVSFGSGEEFAEHKGSEVSDEMYFDGTRVKTYSNNCGGILGGITNGMPIIIRATLKPTPSIRKKQRTVNLETMENTEITVNGRHDVCIGVRAAAALEAAVCLALYDILKGNGNV